MTAIKSSQHWWGRWYWQLLGILGIYRKTNEDHYVGKTLSWPVRGREGEIQTRTITAYDGATKTITIESTTGPSG